MMASTSTFVGTPLSVGSPSSKAVRPSGRSQTTITARIFRPIRPQKDKETVERGERSQAKREKKLIPYDQKLFDSIPGKSKKMFDARNVPREGGMGGGGPYQPITRKQTLGIDPILFVVALVGGFLFLLANATKTGTIS